MKLEISIYQLEKTNYYTSITKIFPNLGGEGRGEERREREKRADHIGHLCVVQFQ
jgi:hypothetical protein